MVTPDIALQRKAVFRLYSMLSAHDPATARNERVAKWNGTKAARSKRAGNETVSIEIASVLPQTSETWQVDWIETVRDRQGALKGKPFRMRALLTVYISPTTPQTTEEQLRNQPAQYLYTRLLMVQTAVRSREHEKTHDIFPRLRDQHNRCCKRNRPIRSSPICTSPAKT